MSVRWYVNRLAAMGPAELVHRVGEKLKKESARTRMEGWARYPGMAVTPLPGLRDRLLSADQTLRNKIAASAKAILDGKFSALGVDWPQRDANQLFPADFWRLDPVSKNLWPGADRYCFDISYRHERDLGDIKYVWEFNRLQFLQVLAAYALLSDDDRCVAAIETAIASWHTANPPFKGLGWNSGIELALRAISLLIVVTLVGDRLSQECRAQIGAILHAHAVWLRRYPSRFSSANNHLVAEAAAEFLLGLAMPDLSFSKSMQSHARAVLLAETQKQILPDGVPAEQSPSYGAFTAEFITLCAVVARDAGEAFPPETDTRLAAFSDFLSWIALDDASVPAFGDDDDGRVLTLSTPEHHYPASVANAVCGYLGQPAPTSAGADFRSCLFGQPKPQRIASTGVKTFATDGYSAVNDTVAGRRAQLLFDHAPLGYLSIAAHGHADALSIMLALDGEPVLVDPGTYLYHSGGVWRDWFRGTRAHNTLTLAGTDQSQISGSFNWSHKAKATLDTAETGKNWSLTASHDGYQKAFGVVHQRQVQRSETDLLITDKLLGKSLSETAEVVFQLAPGLTGSVDGASVIVRKANQNLLTLRFETPDIRIEHGGTQPGGGFVSPSFGIKQAADRIVWTGQVSAQGRTVALNFAPLGDNDAKTKAMELVS